jgi:hypothetical protein
LFPDGVCEGVERFQAPIRSGCLGLGLRVIGLRGFDVARSDCLAGSEAAGPIKNLQTTVFFGPCLGQVGKGGTYLWRIDFRQDLTYFNGIAWRDSNRGDPTRDADTNPSRHVLIVDYPGTQ